MSAQSDAGYSWSNANNLAGMKLGKPGDPLHTLSRPFIKAGDKAKKAKEKEAKAAEAQASKEAASAEFDRRVQVKADAQVKVIREKGRVARATSKAKTQNVMATVEARKSAREHAEQAPIRRAAARAAVKATAPKGAPRKRAHSPVVKATFTSAVGDSPVAAPSKKKSPVAGSDIIDLSGVSPADALND